MFSANDPILECVPNFSEGRDQNIIDAIGTSIKKISGIKLLHVDSGYDANRTVYTFAGQPYAVIDAAFQAIQTASELIDMRHQHGVHPRMGACDVCPLIPVRNISIEATVELSRQLGKRVGELGIPVYLYEFSATHHERKNLAYLRNGEYEGIEQKILLPEWKPDFGPQVFNEKSGMMALGARKFLIAYNINLKTKDVSIAKQIAKRIRESGTGKEKGLLKAIRAIGWYMEEFHCAQVSCNITDFEQTSLKELFDTVKKLANEYGTDVKGSELIGLIPEKALTDGFSSPEEAIHHLGLNVKEHFDINERVLENILFKH
jgi:glutamate formiminotransferase/formiminotetrahydrofolate cyclodeaminase